MSQFRSTLGRVRGLGSAKEGVSHWWAQRATAVALVPLTLWFVIGVIGHAGADYGAMTAWVRQPVTAALLVLLIGTAFYHGALGLQVVIEDYVHNEGQKVAGIILVKGLAYLLAAIGIVSVLKLAFGG